jgi:hypothetical protein
MSLECQQFYPGQEATPEQILMLAHEYRRAAEALLPTGRRGKSLSRAPYRLLAIQAIELYLNAVLLNRVLPPEKLRGLHHNLGARAILAPAAGLTLRKSTIGYLHHLSDSREYVIIRYDPERTGPGSDLTRLAATLREVAEKATAILEKQQELSPRR